jgi:DNA-binding NarL/FixJ family response regulator
VGIAVKNGRPGLTGFSDRAAALPGRVSARTQWEPEQATGRASVRLVLAESSLLLREGLCRLLSEAGFDVVGTAADGEAAVRVVTEVHPDVAVIDIRMPPSFTDEGLRAIREIRLRDPDVGVLVLSQYLDTGYVVELMSQGAKAVGYLLKDHLSDLDELVDAVRRVGSGGCVIDAEVVTGLLERGRPADELGDLTGREREVLELMAQGRSNHAIANLLLLSEKTVEAHVRSIFTKLGLMPSSDDHRRVLAVLRHLRSSSGGRQPGRPRSARTSSALPRQG